MTKTPPTYDPDTTKHTGTLGFEECDVNEIRIHEFGAGFKHTGFVADLGLRHRTA